MESTSKAEEKKKLGNDEHKKGNYVQAVKLYSEAIGKVVSFLIYNKLYIGFKPNEASYYTNRALSYINMKDFKRAIEDCETALKVNPVFGRAH